MAGPNSTASPPRPGRSSRAERWRPDVKGGNIITKEKFDGAFKLHVEFRVPYLPKQTGQGRGNSGVYLQGRYEVQVLDSYGLKSKDDDCAWDLQGGRDSSSSTTCKARRPSGKSYDIEFHLAEAARMER